MVDVRYVPADGVAWRAVVSGDAVAVLAPSVSIAAAESVWRRVDGGGIGAVLDALTGAFGTSLTALPAFALIAVEAGGVRVAVRGELSVVVEGPDGERVDGRGVTTWAERMLPGATAVSVDLGAGADAAAALPLVSGIAPIASLSLALTAPATARMTEPSHADRAQRATPDAAADTIAGVPGAVDVAATTTAASATTTAPPDADADAGALPTEQRVADTWLPETSTAVPAATADTGPVDPVDPVDVAEAATIARPPVVAVTGAPLGGSPASADEHEQLGDHDGETIAVADLQARRAAAAREQQYESTENVPARRPARGRVRVSDGRLVELDRAVVVGRRPRSVRSSDADLPQLVAVDSPEQDISRSHIEIRAEGEHVIVTDLHTTNGTILHRSGHDPVRLHPGEPTMVVTDDMLDIGDGVTLTFEDLP